MRTTALACLSTKLCCGAQHPAITTMCAPVQSESCTKPVCYPGQPTNDSTHAAASTRFRHGVQCLSQPSADKLLLLYRWAMTVC